MSNKYIGIDIGGANTKIASSDKEIIELHYLPLWKNTSLPKVLKDIAQRLKPKKVGVVMTGELADCFKSKEEGVCFIMDAVNNAFDTSDASLYYLDLDGNFTPYPSNPRSLAAANWIASTTLIGMEFEDCIFLDIGSTTSDIIPIINSKPVASKTDFERLKRDELVYTGVLRTNIATLFNLDHKVKIQDVHCRVSSELFAITADAYLLLDEITKELYTCETPDGAEKDKDSARLRLARLVCADLTEISEKEITDIARQVKEVQVNDIANAIQTQINKYPNLDNIVATGLGEFS